MQSSADVLTTGRTRIFHVHHKPLYAAIGEPDNRNRRRLTIDRAMERLMVLDGVLADRSVTWLGSEREKRRYFKQRLGDGLRDDEYPRLVFGERPNVTVRYFPDKLPIGYDRDHYRHVFMYLARSPSPMDFRVFILRHLELLNALGFWTIRVLFPRSLAASMEAYTKAAYTYDTRRRCHRLSTASNRRVKISVGPSTRSARSGHSPLKVARHERAFGLAKAGRRRVEWWRRRESNPRPRVRPRGTLHA